MLLASLVFAAAASALVTQLLPDDRIEQCRNAVRSQTGLSRVPDPEPVVSQFIYRTRIELPGGETVAAVCNFSGGPVPRVRLDVEEPQEEPLESPAPVRSAAAR